MEVGRAIAEAWQWLQNEGLLMPDLDQPNGWFCLTRKGAALRTGADLEAYRQGGLLPSALLHPTFAEKMRPMFMRGDYDVAVFQSFKEVEVAVREAARMSNSDIGRKLMQAAFNPDTGPLMIVGGESGPSAREMRPEWSESFKIALKEDVLHREWNDFPLSSSFAVAAE
jgi:hypothetical protein